MEISTLIERLKKSDIVEFDRSGCDLYSGHYDDIEMMIDAVLQHTKNIEISLHKVDLNKFVRLFNGDYKIVINNCDGANFNGNIKHVTGIHIRNDSCIDWIKNATELEILQINNNKLTTFPCFSINLRSLYLSKNELSSLPDSFANLTNLKDLILNNNCFTTIPDVLQGMSIKNLNFDNNPITIIPDFVYIMPKLEGLFLAGTKLEILPKNVNINILT